MNEINKIMYLILFIFLICSCNKNDGYTSSGVQIIEANGDENYLNQPSDSIFNQDKLPILEINWKSTFFNDPPKSEGTNIIAWANIIGITPDALSLRGIYCLVPATFLSNPPEDVRLAY